MGSFKKNPRVEEELQGELSMGLMLKERLEVAENIAQSTAPVDSGAYRDGISGVVLEVGSRWVGRLNAFDFKSHWIEFGTATGFAARATLRQACERAGFYIRSTR